MDPPLQYDIIDLKGVFHKVRFIGLKEQISFSKIELKKGNEIESESNCADI